MERHLGRFAVHQATFAFQKNFQSMQLEREIPRHSFSSFFFTSVCRCALCLQLSTSYPNHLVPPASLSWLSYHNGCIKRQDFCLETPFGHRQWCQLCFMMDRQSRGLWDICLMEMTNTCVEKHMEFLVYKCYLFHARIVNARGICVASVTDNTALLQEAEPHQIRVFISPRRRPVRVPCQCTSFIKYSPAPHVFDRSFMWKVTRRLQRGRCLNLFSSSHSSRGSDLV